MNAQSQQQSIQAKAQADMQLEQMSGQAKLAVVTTEQKMKQDLSQQDFVQQVLMKSFEMGKELTPELQQIVGAYFQKKQMEEQQIMQQQMAEQQQMAQQQQMQEQGQEEQIPEEQQ